MDEQPFRFYGARPDDWFEGACCGHTWEVQFQTPLHAEVRARLAIALREAAALYSFIDTECGPCQFCGAWLRITMGESASSDIDIFWDEVQSMWEHVHGAVPIEEVHFQGTREPGADPWSEWSVAQKPKPGPAPIWCGDEVDIDVYGHGMERFAAELVEDAEFEAARRSPSAPPAPGDQALLEAAEAAGRVVLLSAPELAPAPEPYAESVQSMAHSTSWSRPIGHGRFYALEQRGSKYAAQVVDAEGIHDLDLGTSPSWFWDVSCDRQVLLLARNREVFRVELDGLSVDRLPRQPGKVAGMAELGERMVIEQTLKTGRVLDLLQRSDGEWRRCARVPCGSYGFFRAVPRHGLLVVTDSDESGERPTLLLAVGSDGFRILGTSAFPVREMWEHEDEVVLLSRSDDGLVSEFENDGLSLRLVTKRGQILRIGNLAAAITHAQDRAPVDDLREVAAAVELCVDGVARRLDDDSFDDDDLDDDDLDDDDLDE